jgi:uncharacterized membrane protein YhaH (DUF805 family)
MYEAIQDGFNRYGEFSGKSTRSQYWYFLFGTTLMTFVASFLAGEMVGNLVALATLIPTIAAAVRRMHDVGKSGWFLLLPVYNFILLVTPSKN